MNDICKSCGAELPPTPPGLKRRQCPKCGATARVIQASVHAVVVAATCEANAIVIRPDPVVLGLQVPAVEVIASEPRDAEKRKRGQGLLELRVAALRVLLEDFARAHGDRDLQPELKERVGVLLIRVLIDMESGAYDG